MVCRSECSAAGARTCAIHESGSFFTIPIFTSPIVDCFLAMRPVVFLAVFRKLSNFHYFRVGHHRCVFVPKFQHEHAGERHERELRNEMQDGVDFHATAGRPAAVL